MSKNIILTGFMGAGKTVTARQLGIKTKFTVVSTDALIEEEEGMPVSQIFQRFGEEYFRQCERETVTKIAKRQKLIVDCGGGIVLDSVNTDRLRASGTLVFLAASPEVLYQRVKAQTHRHLLNTPDPQKTIEDLLNDRKALYEQADVTVNTDGKTAEQVADEILVLLRRVKNKNTF